MARQCQGSAQRRPRGEALQRNLPPGLGYPDLESFHVVRWDTGQFDEQGCGDHLRSLWIRGFVLWPAPDLVPTFRG